MIAYESTIQALSSLYDKVSAGGFVIVDDYGIFANCRAAVTDFRHSRGIRERMYDIDRSAVFWQCGVE